MQDVYRHLPEWAAPGGIQERTRGKGEMPREDLHELPEVDVLRHQRRRGPAPSSTLSIAATQGPKHANAAYAEAWIRRPRP